MVAAASEKVKIVIPVIALEAFRHP
jgi:hypothetical protein